MRNLVGVAALFCLALAGPVHAADGELRANVDSARPAFDFALTGPDGSELRLSRYRGKVVLLAFGFTNCATDCPNTLSVLARAHRKLGADGRNLQVVFVTVDPERDGPSKLQEFLKGFDPSFIGATGTPDQLRRVFQEYRVVAKRVVMGDDPLAYEFDHSKFVYLVDREGTVRGQMPYSRSADDYAHDVAILMKK